MTTQRLLRLGGWILLSISLIVVLTFSEADTKPAHQLDWLDIGTEATLLILSGVWVLMIILARPGGPVTQLLLAGLLGFGCGCLMDLLDEFLVTEGLGLWFALLEKTPTPLGLISLTAGLMLWREEQQAINAQLRTREQFYRQHRLIDPITQLCDARAMDHHLDRTLKQAQPLSLMMIDLKDFHSINQRLGLDGGDRLLAQVAQTLARQIRSCDLVCRYAGDRFILLLPQCGPALAQALRDHLLQQLQPLGTPATVTYCSHSGGTANADDLLQQLNQQMAAAKCPQPWQQAI